MLACQGAKPEIDLSLAGLTDLIAPVIDSVLRTGQNVWHGHWKSRCCEPMRGREERTRCVVLCGVPNAIGEGRTLAAAFVLVIGPPTKTAGTTVETHIRAIVFVCTPYDWPDGRLSWDVSEARECEEIVETTCRRCSPEM